MNLKFLLINSVMMIVIFLTIASATCKFQVSPIIRDPCEEYYRLDRLTEKISATPSHRRHHRQVQIITADYQHLKQKDLKIKKNFLTNDKEIINRKNNEDNLETMIINYKNVEDRNRELKLKKHFENKRRHQIETNHIDNNEIDTNDNESNMSRSKRVDMILEEKIILKCCEDLKECAKQLCLKEYTEM